jgi:hypothetical protein
MHSERVAAGKDMYKEGCAIVGTPSLASCFTKFLQKLAVHLYLF